MKSNNLEAAKMAAYDYSYSYRCDLYDNLPYIRTYERCNENTVCMFSGNVIKAQNINIQDAIIVDNRDNEFLAMIEEARAASSVVSDEEFRVISEEPVEDEAILQGLMSEYVPADEEIQEPDEAPVIFAE